MMSALSEPIDWLQIKAFCEHFRRANSATTQLHPFSCCAAAWPASLALLWLIGNKTLIHYLTLTFYFCVFCFPGQVVRVCCASSEGTETFSSCIIWSSTSPLLHPAKPFSCNQIIKGKAQTRKLDRTIWRFLQPLARPEWEAV